MKNTHLLPALLAACLFSCTDSETVHRMFTAESLLQQKPDSSLAIMESISRKDLSSKKEKALYSLLMTAALDKNYYEIKSDSLINIAADYYSSTTDERHRMLAHYYQGVVYNSNEAYNAAIVALEKAEKDALMLEDHLYAGLISRTKADIFSKNNNLEAAQIWMEDAIKHFTRIEDTRYAAYAELGLAFILINKKDYSAAESQLERVRKIYDDDYLNTYSGLKEALILVVQDKDLNRAVEQFEQSPTNLFDIQDYYYYAIALEKTGKHKEADDQLANAYSLCKDPADSAQVDFMKARVLHLRGIDREAYTLTRKAAFAQDSVTRVLLRQSINDAQRDYYKAEAKYQEEKIGRIKDKNRAAYTLALFAVLLMLGAVAAYKRKKELQVKEQMAMLSLQQQRLNLSEKTTASLLGSLFSERIGQLDKLSKDYIYAESEERKYQAFKQFRKEVDAMREDRELFTSLEDDLDKYCDQIMSKFKTQVPSVNGQSLKLATLFFCGLPYSTIQIIMGSVSEDSLKMARSRIRKKIKEANAQDTDLFLDYLDMKKNRGHQ